MLVWIFKTIADHGDPWEVILLILQKQNLLLSYKYGKITGIEEGSKHFLVVKTNCFPWLQISVFNK